MVDEMVAFFWMAVSRLSWRVSRRRLFHRLVESKMDRCCLIQERLLDWIRHHASQCAEWRSCHLREKGVDRIEREALCLGKDLGLRPSSIAPQIQSLFAFRTPPTTTPLRFSKNASTEAPDDVEAGRGESSLHPRKSPLPAYRPGCFPQVKFVR
jgi:hypothetical protein